jgi:hypothetical protein
LTDEQWADVQLVRDTVLFHLDSMIQEINDYVSGDSQSISPEITQGAKEWLGIELFNSRDFKKFANDLTKIRDNLASKKRSDFKMYPAKGDYYAEVFSSGSHIHLRPEFFNLPNSSLTRHTKQGALIHEITHFMFVLATVDLTYNVGEARAIARDPRNGMHLNPGALEAPSNADNWLFFYQGYAFRPR